MEVNEILILSMVSCYSEILSNVVSATKVQPTNFSY